MRTDIAIALVASLALHGGFILLPGKTPAQNTVPPTYVPPNTPRFILPPIEDDPVPIVADVPQPDKTPVLIGPPRSDELLVVVTDPSQFIQSPEPPRPEGIIIDQNGSIIPNTPETEFHKQTTNILNPKDLDQAPVARVQIKPVYPFERRREGASGTALVSFIVDTKGNVVNAYAVEASLPEFGTAAAQAVSKWKFRPGMKNAKPANTRMQIPIVFNIDDANR